jgi:pSer/pThr/pTyr-binding forkhead associated (FHA) protein
LWRQRDSMIIYLLFKIYKISLFLSFFFVYFLTFLYDPKMNKIADIIVINKNGSEGKSFPLIDKKCVFGRMIDCDIRLQLPTVSKRHCVIEFDENGCAWLDDLSTNGTMVNQNMMKRHMLCDGDIITIGDRSFRFYYNPSQVEVASKNIMSKKVETPKKLPKQPTQNLYSERRKRLETEYTKYTAGISAPNSVAKPSSMSLVDTWSVSDTQVSTTQNLDPVTSPLKGVDDERECMKNSLDRNHTPEFAVSLTSNKEETMVDVSQKWSPVAPTPFKHLIRGRSNKPSSFKRPARRSSMINEAPKNLSLKKKIRYSAKIWLNHSTPRKAQSSDKEIENNLQPLSPFEEMRARRNANMITSKHPGYDAEHFMPMDSGMTQVTPNATPYRKSNLEILTGSRKKNFEFPTSVYEMSNMREQHPSSTAYLTTENYLPTPTKLKLQTKDNSVMLKQTKKHDTLSTPLKKFIETEVDLERQTNRKGTLSTPLKEPVIKKLVTPLKDEIRHFLKLATPLRNEIQNPKRLKVTTISQKKAIEQDGELLPNKVSNDDMVSPLNEEVKGNGSPQTVAMTRVLPNNLKEEIEKEGIIHLRKSKNHPTLATPINRQTWGRIPTEETKIHHKLVTPLRSMIEKGTNLRPTRNFKRLDSTLKKEIETKVELKPKIIGRKLPSPLRKTIQKGISLKPVESHSEILTPLRMKIKQGIALKRRPRAQLCVSTLEEEIVTQKIGGDLTEEFIEFATPPRSHMQRKTSQKPLTSLEEPISNDITHHQSNQPPSSPPKLDECNISPKKPLPMDKTKQREKRTRRPTNIEVNIEELVDASLNNNLENQNLSMKQTHSVRPKANSHVATEDSKIDDGNNASPPPCTPPTTRRTTKRATETLLTTGTRTRRSRKNSEYLSSEISIAPSTDVATTTTRPTRVLRSSKKDHNTMESSIAEEASTLSKAKEQIIPILKESSPSKDEQPPKRSNTRGRKKSQDTTIVASNEPHEVSEPKPRKSRQKEPETVLPVDLPSAATTQGSLTTRGRRTTNKKSSSASGDLPEIPKRSRRNTRSTTTTTTHPESLLS